MDLILHHYPESPYAEKARLALGLKSASWRSVKIPVVMPKPELIPLTGGYRRTPVLQIGADIYVDTLLILSVLDRVQPDPPLFPAGGLAQALSWWIEKSCFAAAVSLTASLIGEHFPPALIEDRRALMGNDMSKDGAMAVQPVNRQRMAAHLHWLPLMLADGRPFLLGEAASAADLAAYHPIWFLRRNGRASADALLDFAPLQPWYDRVAGFGNGRPEEMSAQQALEVARAADPSPAPGGEGEVGGCRIGDKVVVCVDGGGGDDVTGVLSIVSADALAVDREAPEVSSVRLHVPRAGFIVRPA